ncbi:uncharacterized protein B0T15DRAFT_304155 [Chaetomium strumarium]|uniref:Uncharacterized protein n=1 Tax=Chaetomium strumarium TaxID=1170767 RepID=A0AAJ0LYI0_9PEZI|nr:hypothetical protein B0T15DRAFT_304155 [Chaetomium strumarium]
MLSNDPTSSSPLSSELHLPSRTVPARALPPDTAALNNGYVSPRSQHETSTSTTRPSPLSLNPPPPSRLSLPPLSEYHSGFASEDSGSPYNPANHRRQQSFPNLVPLALRSRSPSPTKKTEPRRSSEFMPYTGDGRSSARAAAEAQRGGGGGFIKWLSGSSGTADAPQPSLPADAHTTQTALKDAAMPNSTTPKTTMTTASRLMSVVSLRFGPTTPTSPAVDTEKLCNLDIEAALFPHGSPSDGDAFSPSAFKNLQMNAMGVLTKMQTAFREQTVVLRELQAEQSAQKDELEEAETRARHLKMQLEDMARKAQEHEQTIKLLMEELAAERKARAEEQLAAAARPPPVPPSERASMISEDLGVDDDQRQRRMSHRKSWKSSPSCEEDTDEDENASAESESVFSRCRSPGLHLPDGPGTPHARNPTGGSVNVTPKQKSGQQLSAFQKIFKGISGDSGENSGANGCANCRGQDASVAWNTVSLLRDENRHLKTRVGELEVAVEGALDLVNGIWL